MTTHNPTTILARIGALCPSVALTLIASPAACQSEPSNPNTDWFRDAGYGVFVHYVTGLQNTAESVNSLGKETSWDECVREFDVERFADTMEEAGAGYVIFTVMQITRHMIAPNETYDRISGYKPGEACATRDLIEDLYQALHKRGIRLMLYYTGDGPRADAKGAPAFGWESPVTTEFVTRWASVAQEYAERYKDKVAGWWVDGCYQVFGYDDEKLGIMARALKSGNPNAIVALNVVGVQDKVRAYTPREDFTAGEQNEFFDRPVSRWVDGEQWHILSFLGNGWAQAGVRYGKSGMAEYVREVNEVGGVVSVDVLLYRDGSIDRSQLEVLKALRPYMAAAKSQEPIPPGNIAFHKPARLLSLDGSHELQVNGGVHFPRLGVDGDPETTALAGGEWPWTFYVDLLSVHRVRRVKVTFGSGYPTHLRIMLSADGKEWTQIADVDGHDGSPYECAFDPVDAEYVRICSVKPDGPDQPGAQMSVAELEVYE